jgi:hypothetical protein
MIFMHNFINRPIAKNATIEIFDIKKNSDIYPYVLWQLCWLERCTGIGIELTQNAPWRGALGVFNTVIPQANFVNYHSFWSKIANTVYHKISNIVIPQFFKENTEIP